MALQLGTTLPTVYVPTSSEYRGVSYAGLGSTFKFHLGKKIFLPVLILLEE